MFMLCISSATLLPFVVTSTKISNEAFRKHVLLICHSCNEAVYRWAMHAVDLTISEYKLIPIYVYALLLQLRRGRAEILSLKEHIN